MAVVIGVLLSFVAGAGLGFAYHNYLVNKAKAGVSKL